MPTARPLQAGSVGSWGTELNAWLDENLVARAFTTKVANHTLVLADANTAVEMNAAGALTLTIPTNATVAFPLGTKVYVVQIGAGAVTVAGAGGVTVSGAVLATSAIGQMLVLRKRLTDTWVVEVSPSSPSRALKTARDDVGDFSITSITWANLDTALDLTLAAQVGDLIEIGASLYWEAGAAGIYGCLDVVSVVSAAPVNAWGNGAAVDANHYGIAAWIGAPAVISPRGGGAVKAIVAGDLSSGTVTLRLRTRIDTAGTKVIQARATVPFQWWAKNLGPAS